MLLKLQNILFPEIGICDQGKLYYRINSEVHLNRDEQTLDFEKKGVANFDTYFNGFSIEKWKKYTQIGQVSLVLVLQGEFEITLRNKEKTNKIISNREHFSRRIRSETPHEFVFPFNPYENKGLYCFSLESFSEDARLFGGWYSTELAEDQLREVNIAINICTFRREIFVKRNLNMLNEKILQNAENELSSHVHVFISDNGKTLDIVSLENEKVHIVPNKNVGGAGGFTRNLIEIMHYPNYQPTHILFMDDDIIIEPESIYRTYIMLRCIKEEYRDAFIGGAMLRLDEPYLQVEAGAVWNAGNLRGLKKDLDLRYLDAVLYNEIEEYREYNAWWYCCMPMVLVNEENLPLPLFIRGDDLEYGLRNMKCLILLNGICVWHEPFENKYSSFLIYYILRNMLYDNAIHCPQFNKMAVIKQIGKFIIREILYYRYNNADLIERALDDYLKGINFLKNTDGEKLHREIMEAGYKAKPVEELSIPFSYVQYDESLEVQRTGIGKLLYPLTLNGMLLPSKGDRIVSMALCRPVNFYRAKRVLQYDATSGKGFVTEKSFMGMIRCIGKLVSMICKVIVKYDRATEILRRDIKVVLTEDFWRNYLAM